VGPVLPVGYSAIFFNKTLINILGFLNISLYLNPPSCNYAPNLRNCTTEAACGVFSGVDAKDIHERRQHSEYY
jgi:hypothetical protein